MFERDRRRIASFAPVRRNWIEFNSEASPPLVCLLQKGGGGFKDQGGLLETPPTYCVWFCYFKREQMQNWWMTMRCQFKLKSPPHGFPIWVKMLNYWVCAMQKAKRFRHQLVLDSHHLRCKWFLAPTPTRSIKYATNGASIPM